jgi:hypothetical protein
MKRKILFQESFSKSDWDKSIASFEVAAVKKSLFSVKVLPSVNESSR